MKSGRVDQIGCFFSRRIWKAMASTRNISAGDLDQRQTESQGGFEGESHCWTDPIRLKQDKQLGVDVLCPRLLWSALSFPPSPVRPVFLCYLFIFSFYETMRGWDIKNGGAARGSNLLRSVPAFCCFFSFLLSAALDPRVDLWHVMNSPLSGLNGSLGDGPVDWRSRGQTVAGWEGRDSWWREDGGKVSGPIRTSGPGFACVPPSIGDRVV